MQGDDTIRVSGPAVQTVDRLKTLVRKLLTELELAEQDRLEETYEVDFYEEVRSFEIQLIIRALTHCEGHQLHAARLIKLNPSTLNAKIKQYKIRVNTFSRDDVP